MVATRHPSSIAFLLAQIGAHAASRFAERLAELELLPAHAGTLRLVAANPGISQQTLSSTLGLAPSRLVALVDDLEERGLVERRNRAEDRRAYALHLTRKGTAAVESIAKISRAHDDATCRALDGQERRQLAAMLRRLADEQGLTPGVHPGFSRIGREHARRR